MKIATKKCKEKIAAKSSKSRRTATRSNAMAKRE